MLVSACHAASPPLPVTNDPVNCDTYRSFTIVLQAAAVMAAKQPDALDAHNTNEANAHACKLGQRRTLGSP